SPHPIFIQNDTSEINTSILSLYQSTAIHLTSPQIINISDTSKYLSLPSFSEKIRRGASLEKMKKTTNK
ncbi:MAG: hypothetical protein WBB68_03580, partial [Candidatus Moraniibacteriota bacterium]